MVPPSVAEAFKKGGGVSFESYPEEISSAIDLINQGNYQGRFISYWLNTLPDVVKN